MGIAFLIFFLIKTCVAYVILVFWWITLRCESRACNLYFKTMLKYADSDAVLPPGYGYSSETCFLVQASKMIWGGWMLLVVFEFSSLYNFIFIPAGLLIPLYSRLWFIGVSSALSMYVMIYPLPIFSLNVALIRQLWWHVPARMGHISRWQVSQLIHGCILISLTLCQALCIMFT